MNNEKKETFYNYFPLFPSFPFLYYPILKLWREENKKLANASVMDLIPNMSRLDMDERMVSLG